MKIEDEELRALFQAESEEHLQRMDEGLLRSGARAAKPINAGGGVSRGS